MRKTMIFNYDMDHIISIIVFERCKRNITEIISFAFHS
jgi:hypothetical protein